MIDPVTTLALSMQTKKGAYALLLGSGLSRSAQIPTGWDIVLDLIRRVAAAEKRDAGDDPASWYRESYGEEPDYGVLLGRLVRTSAERSQIIRQYIEPSPDQRDLGMKLPTDAHRAIASLAAEGYVRVIVTTNFDRLLESALGDMGVVPAVIDSADAADGTLPLVHNACTVIKVHGDYIDARIKNTSAELEEYPQAINGVLDQVFREYGLVVCGWSGEWDSALREALQRSQSRWFATYWVSYREPRAAAQELIDQRDAKVIANMDADSFFQRLSESVVSLEDLSSPELVSATMARAALKRYIDDPSKRIRLHDLVVGEASRVRLAIEEAPLESYLVALTQDEVTNRVEQYENSTTVLRTLFITGCYWGEEGHEGHWIIALERLGSFPRLGQHNPPWERLRRYPALSVLYAGGVAALARGRYGTLRALLYGPMSNDNDQGVRTPMIINVHPRLMNEAGERALAPGIIPAAVLPERLRHHEPLRDPLREYLPLDDQFEACFDRFEYFFGLVHTDVALQTGAGVWGPRGVFAFRDGGYSTRQLIESTGSEIETQRESWPPLRAGMFGGTLERLATAKAQYDNILR